MVRNNEERQKGTQILEKVSKEKTTPPMRPKKMKIKSRLSRKENFTTWKENSRKLNPPVLMGSQRLGRKKNLGYWTLRNTSKIKIIPTT